jgi:hypothetical protein
VKDAFAKKFLVPGEIPLSALAPSRRAAAASEPSLALLRARRERPCSRRAAAKQKEFAPSYT